MKLKCIVKGREIKLPTGKRLRPIFGESFTVDDEVGESLKLQPYFEENKKDKKEKGGKDS